MVRVISEIVLLVLACVCAGTMSASVHDFVNVPAGDFNQSVKHYRKFLVSASGLLGVLALFVLFVHP